MARVELGFAFIVEAREVFNERNDIWAFFDT